MKHELRKSHSLTFEASYKYMNQEALLVCGSVFQNQVEKYLRKVRPELRITFISC